jgi:hypothetical protein
VESHRREKHDHRCGKPNLHPMHGIPRATKGFLG